MNDSAGTCFGASTAAIAKLLIDGGAEALHTNGAFGTGLFALFTADTAHVTGSHHVFSLFCGFAKHRKSGRSGNHLNNLLGTCLLTGTATAAMIPIHLCHPIHNLKGIEFADPLAISQADATVWAKLFSSRQAGGNAAVENPLVSIFVFGTATAAAHDLCNLADNLFFL